jgi:hypothetical protein
VGNENRAAFGVFYGNSEVEVAKAELKEQGLPSSSVSVLYPPHHVSKSQMKFYKAIGSKSALIGGISGAVIFVLIGLTIDLGFQALSIHRGLMSPVSKIMVGLATFIAGGFLGAVCGALVGMAIGSPQSTVERLADDLESGAILMSVHVEDPREVDIVKDVLEKSGGQDITFLDEDQGWKSVKDQMRNRTS